jgi:hypothetical protein
VSFGKTNISMPGGVRRSALAGLCLAGMTAAWLAAPAASAQASAHKVVTGSAQQVVTGKRHKTATSGVVVGTAKVPSAKQVLAYWTAARLRQAKAADVVVAGKAPHLLQPTAKADGKPGHVAGGLPDGRGAAPVRAAHTPSLASYTYPYPYDVFTPSPSLWPTYPYEVNGKLFFTNDGADYVCSGTSVGSESGTSDEDEIWTAGHCLVNTEANNQVVDSYAIFIPAYNGNVSNFDPFGEFVWNGDWATSSAWYDNRDLTEDEAAMTMDTSSSTGRTLGQAVGWDGFAWNYPVNEQFVAFGYPAAAPYNGNNLIEDIGSTAGQDSISGADSTEPIAIGNPMTGGSSGGAWNIDWTTAGPGYIDGHNDYKYTNQSLAMYSPYQDSLSNEVRCFGATSC